MKNKFTIILIVGTFLFSCSLPLEDTSIVKTYNPSIPIEYSTPKCEANQIPLIPLFHNPPDAPDPLLQGLNVPEKFIEDGVLACRRFIPEKDSIITNVLIDYAKQSNCTQFAQLLTAVGELNQVSNLIWEEGTNLPLENTLCFSKYPFSSLYCFLLFL